MHSMTFSGGGGTNAAFPGPRPPIQFWVPRNSARTFLAAAASDKSESCNLRESDEETTGNLRAVGEGRFIGCNVI